MTPTDFLMSIHISAGALALVTFPVALLTAKGGAAHRRAGRMFVLAMGAVCFTAIPVSLIHLSAARTAGAALFSKGALFVTLLSGAAVWKGVRVLRFKGSGANRHPLDLGLPALIFMAGCWALIQGAAARNLILLFFGALAVQRGIVDLRYWLNPEKPRMHWFFEHLGAMMGATTAAITAFLFFGARSLGAAAPGLVEFLLPTLVLVPVSAFWARSYRRKFGLIGQTDRSTKSPGSEPLDVSSPPSVPGSASSCGISGPKRSRLSRRRASPGATWTCIPTRAGTSSRKWRCTACA